MKVDLCNHPTSSLPLRMPGEGFLVFGPLTLQKAEIIIPESPFFIRDPYELRRVIIEENEVSVFARFLYENNLGNALRPVLSPQRLSEEYFMYRDGIGNLFYQKDEVRILHFRHYYAEVN